MLKKLLRIVFFVLIGVALVSVCLFTTVDRSPYRESDYYKKAIGIIDSLTAPANSSTDTLKIGWAKVSLVPISPIPIAGYGKRKGANYEGIRDSVFVRTYVFEQGGILAAYISLDMLIVPPLVYAQVLKSIDPTRFNDQNIFFTASHSHSSIGAWQPGLVGTLFSGEFDEGVIQFIAERVVESIYLATQSTSKAKVGFAAIEAGDLVTNRLVGDQRGSIDPWFRYLKIQKESGEVAFLCSFSAHATCYGSKSLELSNDYPGRLIQLLEEHPDIDFASYGAGAVGSMKPLIPPMPEKDQVEYLAERLSSEVTLLHGLTNMEFITSLGFTRVPIPLREPHFRVANNIRVRPWVFSKLFGTVNPTINVLKIGNNLLVGTPCDFSGELVAPLDSAFKAKDTYLMLHSFNGSYIGYVTHDDWYDLGKYETETMGWFGPYNGAYFSEMILRFGSKFTHTH